MYTLSHHAKTTIASKGFSVPAVLAAANTPAVTYDNLRVPGQMRHIRDNVVAVVDPTRRVVITAYANVVETEQRADQTDDDARAHFSKRADRDRKRRERQARDRAFTAAQKKIK